MGNSMKTVLIVLVSIFIVLATALILLKLLKKNRDFDHSDDTSSLLGGENDITTFNEWILTKDNPESIFGNIPIPTAKDKFSEDRTFNNIYCLTFLNEYFRIRYGDENVKLLKNIFNSENDMNNPVDLGNYLNITRISKTLMDENGQYDNLMKEFYLVEFSEYDVIAYSEQIPCDLPLDDQKEIIENACYTVALKRHNNPDKKAFIIHKQKQEPPIRNQSNGINSASTNNGKEGMHTFNGWLLSDVKDLKEGLEKNLLAIIEKPQAPLIRMFVDDSKGEPWIDFDNGNDISTLRKLTSTSEEDRSSGMTALDSIKNMLTTNMENHVNLGNYLNTTMITETLMDENGQYDKLMKEFYFIEFSEYDVIAYSDQIPRDSPSDHICNSYYNLALRKHNNSNGNAYRQAYLFY